MMRASTGLALSLLFSLPLFAQLAVRTPATTTHPEFEIADVHVSPHRTFPFMDGGMLRGDRYNLRQATMVDLISTAYGVDAKSVQGGPPWLETNRFDIVAKAPPGTPPATLKLMLKALLADRFKLVI